MMAIRQFTARFSQVGNREPPAFVRAGGPLCTYWWFSLGYFAVSVPVGLLATLPPQSLRALQPAAIGVDAVLGLSFFIFLGAAAARRRALAREVRTHAGRVCCRCAHPLLADDGMVTCVECGFQQDAAETRRWWARTLRIRDVPGWPGSING
jgi:hypothetical protein